MKAVGAKTPKATKLGRFKLLSLLALFVVGSALSVLTSLVTPDLANARTAAQKQYCLDNYPAGTTIYSVISSGSPYVPSTTTEKPQGWIDNQCESMCPLDSDLGVGVVEYKSKGCDANAPITIEAKPAVVDAVKKGYGDLAAKTICAPENNQGCIDGMQNRVNSCVDKYMANAPANAPEFPDINTNALADCMAEGQFLNPTNLKKIKDAFKTGMKDVSEAANKANAVADKQACKDSGGTYNSESGECGTNVTCNKTIEGIGWLVCPAMNFMATVSDWAYTFIASTFLSTNLDMSTDKSALRDSWAKFRDVANVAFVIALLIVIYSQITSVGISNYGIKKMLPKIVVAAILVNLSFTICAIAVDLSNILGFGVTKFFESLGSSFMQLDPSKTSATTATYGLDNGLTYVGAIAAVGLAGVGIALGLSIPVLLSALLAVGLIALILMARQALIVLLIVIAPLAFVAYLLPNTEQWFKKWVKMFSTLLLLFPIIGVVFGASRLAANVVYESGTSLPDGTKPIIMQIMALGVMAVPFFVVPGLLKGALSAAGAIGAKMQGWADKAGKSASSGAVDRAKSKSQLYQTYQAGKKYREGQRAAALAKKRGTGLSAVMGGFAGGKGFNARARQSASDLENQEFEERVKSISGSDAFGAEHHDEIIDKARGYSVDAQGNRTAVAVSDEERVAAIRYAAKSGSASDIAGMEVSAGASSSVKRATIDAFREKKINNVTGNGVLSDIAANGTSQQAVDKQIVERMNNGDISAETAVQSESTPGLIRKAIKREEGNGNGLTADGTNNVQKLVNEVYGNESTRKAVQGSMQKDFEGMGATIPPNP